MDEPSDNRPKILPQYRRKLKDIAPHSVANESVDTNADNIIKKYPILMLVIPIVAIFILFVGYKNITSAPLTKEIINEQSAHSFIVLYSPETHPVTKVLQQIAAMYGLQTMIKPPLGNEVKVGIASGKIMSAKDFVNALQNVPIYNFHPGSQPGTIYLYTVEACPYAEKARQMLKSKGIPFIEVNLNDSSNPAMDGLEARVIVSGYEGAGIRNPYLEYNNKIYPNPDLYNVIENIQ